jgi:hypothetical protein
VAAQEPAQLAIRAQALYLINLLIAPGLAFVVLAVLWLRQRRNADAVTRSHLDSALRGSVLAGVMLIAVTLGILGLGGFSRPGTWVFLIIYFVTIHAALVLAGVIGLVRAMGGQPFYFPGAGVRPSRASRRSRDAE